MENSNDVIITGVPRSGTTLTCYLLNKLPAVVALHEPMQPSNYYGLDSNALQAEIQHFFTSQRELILRERHATSKSYSGTIPDNPAGNIDARTGKREKLFDGTSIVIDRPLARDFKLAIKHPSMFTAILEKLTQNFSCFSIIRNPLSVLLSWNSVDMPIAEGHVPAAEAFDKKLSDKLINQENKYVRQLIILEWFYEKYKINLTDKQIIRYEDIISTGGKKLAAIDSAANHLNESLKSKNNNKLYHRENIFFFADILLNSKGAFWDFYDKKDVLELCRSNL